MEYFVADTYQNWERIGEPFTKDGKLYINLKEGCGRCLNGIYVSRFENGQPVPHPYYGGVCLRCGGTGYVKTAARLYSKSEKEALDRAKNRRKEKAEQEAEARRQARIAALPAKRVEWLEAHGFSPAGVTFVVAGENTYSIKDYLKEQGAKFDTTLKWHIAKEIELPEGFHLIPFSFETLMAWESDIDATAAYYPSAKADVEKKIQEVEGPSKSNHVGAVGDRLKNVTAVFKSARGFSGNYGWTNIYTFEIGEDILVWMTASELSLEPGQPVLLSATIKSHTEYKGVKNTQLSRCIVKEVK